MEIVGRQILTVRMMTESFQHRRYTRVARTNTIQQKIHKILELSIYLDFRLFGFNLVEVSSDNQLYL